MTNRASEGERQQALNRLLGLYKAEWLNGELFDLFAEPAYFGQLKTNRPCVLIGGRGTGKTTVLRGLSYEGQFALHGRDQNEISRWNFYGLYYRVNTNRVTAFRGPELTDERWSACFAHYVNLIFCQLMLDFVKWYQEQTNKQISITIAQLKKVQVSLGLQDVQTLEELALAVELATVEFEASINTISDQPPQNLSMQGAPLDELAGALMSSHALKDKQLFFLIDEFENFEDYQQRVLNTIIKHATSAYTFKIGVRELGWRERATLNENEQLTHPADYVRIAVSEVFNKKRFKAFADRVVGDRFKRAYQQFIGEDPPRVEDFLPDLPDLDEADILIDSDLRRELLQLLRENLCSTELVAANGLRSGELYFLWYWCQGNKRESFPDAVRAWVNGDAEWKQRFNNHFFASLFSIRKGKRGIRKYYAGWNVFLALANGNIRYLLELVHMAFLLHFEEGGQLAKPIKSEIQTKAAQEVGRKNLSELEGLSVDGARLTKLLLSLGRIFQVLADDPLGHTPEANQFYLTDTAISPSVGNRVKEILDQAVMHQALVRFHGNKLVDETDTREYDYTMHPIFSSFFIFSHRRKRKLALSSLQILGLVERPRETIREVLEGNNRNNSDKLLLPDQLQLFGSYYEGN